MEDGEPDQEGVSAAGPHLDAVDRLGVSVDQDSRRSGLGSVRMEQIEARMWGARGGVPFSDPRPSIGNPVARGPGIIRVQGVPRSAGDPGPA